MQLFEGGDPFGRQDIRAGRHDLAELHPGGAERLKRAAGAIGEIEWLGLVLRAYDDGIALRYRLPLPASGRFQIRLRLYDTPISSQTGETRASNLPRITRADCR